MITHLKQSQPLRQSEKMPRKDRQMEDLEELIGSKIWQLGTGSLKFAHLKCFDQGYCDLEAEPQIDGAMSVFSKRHSMFVDATEPSRPDAVKRR